MFLISLFRQTSAISPLLFISVDSHWQSCKSAKLAFYIYQNYSFHYKTLDSTVQYKKLISRPQQRCSTFFLHYTLYFCGSSTTMLTQITFLRVVLATALNYISPSGNQLSSIVDNFIFYFSYAYRKTHIPV